MSPRRGVGHSSPLQRRSLYALVRADPDLHSARFRLDFTYKDAQQRWQKIANHLNTLPGAKKEWRHWRKAWQDYKTSRTKRPNSSDITDDVKPEENGLEESIPDPIEELDVTKPKPEEFHDELEGDSDNSYKPLKKSSKTKRHTDNVDGDVSLEHRIKFVLERELEIKSSYYERKLVLMERQVVALERIANTAATLEVREV